MEKLKDVPVSPPRDKPNQTVSHTNNGNSNKSSYKKYTALMEELQAKIDSLNVTEEKKDAISDSIANIIKWYETEDRKLRAKIDSLWNDIARCADGTDQQNTITQQIIAVKEQTIVELNQRIVHLESKLQTTIENNIREIEALKNSALRSEHGPVRGKSNMELKDEAMELKQALLATEDEKTAALVMAAVIYEQNEKLKDQLNAAKQEVEKMMSNIVQQNSTINKWKEMFVEAHAQNDQLNQKIADLVGQVQTSSPQDAREIEASKVICSEEADQRYKKMQQIVVEKEQTIDELNQKIAQLEANSSSIVQNVVALKNESVLFNAMAADMNEQNESFKVQLSTTKLKRETWKSNVEQKDNTITFLNQKYGECLSHDYYVELNQKIAPLITDTPVIVENNNFVQLEDVIVGTEINYDLLKGKILVVNKLKRYRGEYNAYNGSFEKMVKLQLNGSFKLRIKKLFNSGWCTVEEINELCMNIDSCELRSLALFNETETLPINDFLTLVESRTIVYLFFGTDVMDENCNYVPIEKLLEYFPNLQTAIIKCGPPSYTNETASNLLELPTFKNLLNFELHYYSPEFDLETFGKFMEKHSWVKFKISIYVYFKDAKYNAPKEIIDKLKADKVDILSSWPKSSSHPEIYLRDYE